MLAVDFDPQRVRAQLQRNSELARDGLAERARQALPQRYLHWTGQDATVQVKRLQ